MGLIIYVDGGSRGNPGPSGAGVVIATDAGARIHEAGYFLGRQTSNAAEYHAVIRALTRAARCGAQPLHVFSDSELLVRQITGQYEVKSPRLTHLYRQVQVLLLRVKNWSFRHIRREENQLADQLANLAMDRGADVVVFDADEGIDDTSLLPPAAPPESSEESSAPAPAAAVAPPIGAGERAVRVVLAKPSPEGVCAAGVPELREFTVQTALPAALCVYAAQALLPTLLAMLNTQPEEFTAVPTMTVRCNRAGCGATFHLSPVRSPNGAKRREAT